MTDQPPLEKTDVSGEEERPPIFKTWRQWYTAILLELVILIVVFRLITVIFR